jgi:uncharacterized membrane protein YgcG
MVYVWGSKSDSDQAYAQNLAVIQTGPELDGNQLGWGDILCFERNGEELIPVHAVAAVMWEILARGHQPADRTADDRARKAWHRNVVALIRDVADAAAEKPWLCTIAGIKFACSPTANTTNGFHATTLFDAGESAPQIAFHGQVRFRLSLNILMLCGMRHAAHYSLADLRGHAQNCLDQLEALGKKGFHDVEEAEDCPALKLARTGQTIYFNVVACMDRAAHESFFYSQQPFSSSPTSWSTAMQSTIKNFDVIYPISRTKESWDHPMNQSTNRALEEKIQNEYGRGQDGGGMLGVGTEKLIVGVLHTLSINTVLVVFRQTMAMVDDVSASIAGKEGLASQVFNLWKKELRIHPMFRMGADSGLGTKSNLGAASTSVKGSHKFLLLGAKGLLFKVQNADGGGGGGGGSVGGGGGSDDDDFSGVGVGGGGGGGVEEEEEEEEQEQEEEQEEEDILLLPKDAVWVLETFYKQLADVRVLLLRGVSCLGSRFS